MWIHIASTIFECWCGIIHDSFHALSNQPVFSDWRIRLVFTGVTSSGSAFNRQVCISSGLDTFPGLRFVSIYHHNWLKQRVLSWASQLAVIRHSGVSCVHTELNCLLNNVAWVNASVEYNCDPLLSGDTPQLSCRWLRIHITCDTDAHIVHKPSASSLQAMADLPLVDRQ